MTELRRLDVILVALRVLLFVPGEDVLVHVPSSLPAALVLVRLVHAEVLPVLPQPHSVDVPVPIDLVGAHVVGNLQAGVLAWQMLHRDVEVDPDLVPPRPSLGSARCRRERELRGSLVRGEEDELLCDEPADGEHAHHRDHASQLRALRHVARHLAEEVCVAHAHHGQRPSNSTRGYQ